MGGRLGVGHIPQVCDSQLGRLGEVAARRHMERLGWRIRATNFRAGREEIDLIVERDQVLAFVEVKTRSGTGVWGSGLEAIDGRKKQRIRRVAAQWLARHPADRRTLRFDAIHVVRGADGSLEVEHLSDAWR